MGYRELKFPPDSVFLVTGGAGFVGSNICDAIISLGYKVKCLDNLSTGKLDNLSDVLNHECFTFIEGDIRDLDTCVNACEKVDYILHQAAWGSVPRSIEMPLLYEEINIRGTLNMMEAARKKDVKKFIYDSSSSVYGDELTLPKTEGKEGKSLSPYALTKRANEEYGRLYANLYGLETIGLRYFNVFGRRQDPHGYYAAVIPKFVKKLLNDESPIINGDGLQSRDFTYVENVVEANLKSCLASDDVKGEVFNIACNGQVKLIYLYRKLNQLLGKDIEATFGPERVGDIRDSFADISKAKAVLGYDPEYDFSTGIELAIGWYKEDCGDIRSSH